MSNSLKEIYQFGRFEVDAEERLLLREGRRLTITPKAFETLLALLRRSGHTVSKDELLDQVWPDVQVEENNLNQSIAALRRALGDGESGDRYIETIRGRGYRFLQPVTLKSEVVATGGQVMSDEEAVPTDASPTAVPAAPPRHPAPAEKAEGVPGLHAVRDPWRRTLGRTLTILSLALVPLGALLLWSNWPLPSPAVTGERQLTHDGRSKDTGALLTDGARVYFCEESVSPGCVLYSVPVTGGDPVPLPGAANFTLFDISPGKTELLGTFSGEQGARALWTVPVGGGSPRRVADVNTRAAAWSPDGQSIAYVRGQDVYTVSKEGGEGRKLASIAGDPGFLQWSSDGQSLRFSVTLPFRTGGVSSALWEMRSDATRLRSLFPRWRNPRRECCGKWTSDGKYFVFQEDPEAGAWHEHRTDLWAIREKQRPLRIRRSEPVRLTNGSLSYYAPAPSPDGRKLFAIGEQTRGELVEWDGGRQQLVTYLGGLEAVWVAFSRNQQWVAYAAYPEGTLWRMKPDGTERTQLTFAPMNADGVAWSPDGTKIALRVQSPGKLLKIYLISPQSGSQPEELLPDDNKEEGIPTWSPDGRRMVFGDVPAVFGQGTGREVIHLCDVASRQQSALPDSGGLWTARWSPDGRYISALTVDQKQRLKLFEFATRRWRDLGAEHVNSPTWSHDSKYIYFDRMPIDRSRSIFRVHIPDGKLEEVATFQGIRRAGAWWGGLAPDDSPIILRDIGVQEIYALDVEWP